VIAAQAAAIEELTAANTRLAERVAQLERMVGRNSGNSSMPPSSDDLPGKIRPAPRPVKGSGRRRGKQKGAPGSFLPWVVSPDEQVAHCPQGQCVCGADLAGAVQVGIEHSHQEHDLPEVRIRVCQHDVYRVRCGCGREHVGALPAGVSRAPSSYGVNLKSLVVYLLVYQHVPVQRCVALIGDLTGGVGPSSGFVHARAHPVRHCGAPGGHADQEVDQPGTCGGVRRDHCARRCGRAETLRPVGFHRGLHRLSSGPPGPALVHRLRHPAYLPRDRCP
jgi:transposase